MCSNWSLSLTPSLLLGLVGRTDFAQILFFVCVWESEEYTWPCFFFPLFLFFFSPPAYARSCTKKVSFCVGEGDPPL